MPIPGLGALPSVTGGPATATSGDASGRSGDIGGITSPIVIGGYKSDGSAAIGAVPGWVPWVVGGVLLAGGLYWVMRGR